MAKAKDQNSAAGQTVELADKDTGFYDPATGLKVVRDQTAKIGDTVGRKTNLALSSGTLLIVGSSKAKSEAAAAEETPAKGKK